MMITLDTLKAEQIRLAAMIEQFSQQSQPTLLILPETAIHLQPGERYAGPVMDADGFISHHLVLMPGLREDITWKDAMAWAEEIGGALPSRQEQALLYANLKSEFEPKWYWSGQVHEDDSSFAWGQFFYGGGQSYGHQSYEGRARAVRRVTA